MKGGFKMAEGNPARSKMGRIGVLLASIVVLPVGNPKSGLPIILSGER